MKDAAAGVHRGARERGGVAGGGGCAATGGAGDRMARCGAYGTLFTWVHRRLGGDRVAHFNAQSYSLDYGRTPQRRELDYVRPTAASVETAKEVKIFGLNGFLIDRYVRLATDFYMANRRLAKRRAGWGALFTAIGTVGYYLAYAYVAWRTLAGQFTVGDLRFLAGSFRRLRTLLEGLLASFSTTAGQALYLDDLFSFFEVEPGILSSENPRPFPQPIRQGFVFEDVGFMYPGAERWAVRHLSWSRSSAKTGPARRRS